MAESSPKFWKTIWEKEKLLITSNFSFSHSVFKRLVMQTCKNQGLFGKGLNTFSNNRDMSKIKDGHAYTNTNNNANIDDTRVMTMSQRFVQKQPS